MAKTLISTHDIAVLGASSSIDITSGIDDTYSVYEFHFVNMHPATNQVDFTVQFNAIQADSTQLTGFNETISSSTFQSQHGEGDGGATVGYYSAYDQGQGTAYQALNYETGYDADQSVSGILTLYDPSDPTFVKHFHARTQTAQGDDYSVDWYTGGYINTTNAVNQISFKFDSGNIDAGTIKMFGVS